MTYDEFLRKLPKAELHIHFGGSVRLETLHALAKSNGIPLPAGREDSLYDYADFIDFLNTFDFVSSCILTRDDFARVVYESLEDGVVSGNLRYREMFFNPSVHLLAGVDPWHMMSGLVEGIKAAEQDFKVRCQLIPAVHRGHTPEVGQEAIELMVADYRESIVGMGSDSGATEDEVIAPFAGIYDFARKSGLRTTVHAAESLNTSENFTLAMDVLRCDRIDHGYDILRDHGMVQRAVDTGICFTCCPSAAAAVLGWPDRSKQPMREMMERGVNVTINTDDPTMFKTDVGREFADTCIAMDTGPDRAIDLCLAAVDAAWLDETDKKVLRADFGDEIRTLRTSYEQTPGFAT